MFLKKKYKKTFFVLKTERVYIVMKTSDSTNSLSALNPDPEQANSSECFICLDSEHESGEPLVDSSLLRTCGCQFKVHPVCWNQWMKDKTDWDCPICRKKSVTNHKSPTPVFAVVEEWSQQRREKKYKILIAFILVSAMAAVIIYQLATTK